MKFTVSNMIALGVAVGVAIGVATHNVGAWIAIGAAIGFALAETEKNGSCISDSTANKTKLPKNQ